MGKDSIRKVKKMSIDEYKMELEEAKLYISQLENENTRIKISNKSLRNNNRALLEGNKKLSRHVERLRKERNELRSINEQISNFAQTYPTNLKASSNEALLFMRRYRFANCSCFSCCFKDAYPSSNVQ